MKKGNTLVIVLVLVAILVIGGLVAYMMTQSQNTTTQETTSNMSEMDKMEGSTAPTQASDGASVDDANAVVIKVSAKNFSYNPTEIRVKKGDTVKIVLDVEAGMHDWVVDEFSARTDVISTGQTAEVTFVANQAGEFEYYCSVGNHRQMGMVGTLVVEE